MARSRPAKTRTDRFVMDPMRLGAIIGGVVAFIATGALVDLFWIAVGGLVGGLIGYAVHTWLTKENARKDTVDLTEHATREELYDRARDLHVPHRSEMTKEELAQAVRQAS
jgi:hypothetical protein